jgi:hypothetical protein
MPDDFSTLLFVQAWLDTFASRFWGPLDEITQSIRISRLQASAADIGAGAIRFEIRLHLMPLEWYAIHSCRLLCPVHRQTAVGPPQVPLLVSSVIYSAFLVSRRRRHTSAHMPDSNQFSSHAPPLSNALEDAFVHTALQSPFASASWSPSHETLICFCQAEGALVGSHSCKDWFPLLPRRLHLQMFPTLRRELPRQHRPRFNGGQGKPSSSRRRPT